MLRSIGKQSGESVELSAAASHVVCVHVLISVSEIVEHVHGRFKTTTLTLKTSNFVLRQ